MFLSRRWRPNKWPFFVAIALEFPLTVALLALFGIAAPNLYREKLWQDGADNGFNSNPNAGLYAAANYRPYTTPKVWSQFITNYNIIISVLSMFLMLCKSVMYVLHVFPPILSVLIHLILIALYTVSIVYQSSSDMTDPTAPQPGAPWYITKSCSVTQNQSLVGYCQQAKASFAGTCAMAGVFAIYLGFSVWSCFPSKQQQAEYNARKRAKEEPFARYDDTTENDEEYNYSEHPTPGALGGVASKYQLMTPRTLTFNKLGGTTGLSMREEKRPAIAASSTLPLRSSSRDESPTIEPVKQPSTMFFPPPPKKAVKNVKISS